MNLKKIALLPFTAVLFSVCVDGDAEIRPALESITSEDLGALIATLASDEFEGRSPSSAGEELTLEFLRSQFENLGLQPGNGESFLQEVPLVKITAKPTAHLTVTTSGSSRRYIYGLDVVAGTRRVVPDINLSNSDMVFVGYGIVAPEYEWDDYAGLDANGKTVVMLVNDPGFATQDPELFHGNSMTYYGRWTYKFEEAARQGAEAVFIVHETDAAGYGWNVVATGWSGPQFGLVADDSNMSRAAVEGWLSNRGARTLFRESGLDFDELKQVAAEPGFRPVPIPAQASIRIENTITESVSSNFMALLPGTIRADEIVIYMGHWDHLGVDSALSGDQIYNGARDNASGTAALIELAEAFTHLEVGPERSILFLAVTAEEQGLLGSAYYATHPVYPLKKTVAAINMDALNTIGRMNDITVVGYGNSDLDRYVEEAARTQGRVVRPDPEPEKGFFYRSDHFSFAKVGIPASYTEPGIDHVTHGEEWAREQMAAYIADRYHQPTDEYDDTWDLSGAIDDIRLLFRMGYRLANETTFPNWTEGTEFRAIRDVTMGND